MLRLLLIAAIAAALGCAARAQSKKIELDPAVAAKSATADAIAAALADDGIVRVVVVARSSSGRSAEQLAAAIRDPSSRAAAKREIAAAIDAILASHRLSHVGAARGAPALVRLTAAPAFSAPVDRRELEALAKDPRVVSIERDRRMGH